MAEGLVRVEQNVAGQREITYVTDSEVEKYLATHPGATVMDADWRPESARATRAAAADKKDDK